jgi:hypothetical protein
MYADVVQLTQEKYQGRLTGSQSNEAAVAWVEAQLSQIGIVPLGGATSLRQNFSYRHWNLDNSSLSNDDNGLLYKSDYQVLDYSPSASLNAEVVFVGYGLTIPSFEAQQYPQCAVGSGGYDDYAGGQIAGKIALVLRHGPNENANINRGCPSEYDIAKRDGHYSFSSKAENARRHGAAGVLIANGPAQGQTGIPFGSLGFRYSESGIAAMGISDEQLAKIAPSIAQWQTQLDQGSTPTVHALGQSARLDVTSHRTPKNSMNLIGTIDSERLTSDSQSFLISAHVDHLGMDAASGKQFPGADDDASGVALVLELARAFRNSAINWARRPIFAVFNGEEQEMVGSCYYVEHPNIALDSLVAMMSVDMVGNGDGIGLSLYGGQDAKNAWIVNLMQNQAASWGQSATIQSMAAWEASDHACFIQSGRSALLAISSGMHAHTHTIEDSIDNINPQSMENAIKALWPGLALMAEGAGGP